LDGLRLAQLSDIHFGSLLGADHLQSVVDDVNGQKPDILFLTGDYVTAVSFRGSNNARARNAWPCAEVLRGVRTRLGCFAVLGNHDCMANPAIVTAAFEANGCEVLRNRALLVEAKGSRLWLAGLDDVLHGSPDVNLMLRDIPSGECVVAGVHEPDFADRLKNYPVDLQISGHSHGGQVRFPGVGAVYLPPGARKYPLGRYLVGGLHLYANPGVGTIHVPMRLLCPPELTMFTLRAPQA
jgi:predicted MPP superfamily phosphohydrolase